MQEYCAVGTIHRNTKTIKDFESIMKYKIYGKCRDYSLASKLAQNWNDICS